MSAKQIVSSLLTAANERENKWQGFLDAPSPSVFPSLPPLPDSPADGECHIRCFPFLHIKPEVTAALFLNQPQMCRHSYLTTSADGTLSEAGSEKRQKKQVLFSQILLGLPWEGR